MVRGQKPDRASGPARAKRKDAARIFPSPWSNSPHSTSSARAHRWSARRFGPVRNVAGPAESHGLHHLPPAMSLADDAPAPLHLVWHEGHEHSSKTSGKSFPRPARKFPARRAPKQIPPIQSTGCCLRRGGLGSATAWSRTKSSDDLPAQDSCSKKRPAAFSPARFRQNRWPTRRRARRTAARRRFSPTR